MTLDQAEVGASVKVLALSFDEELSRRINALGIKVGSTLTILRQATFNGPIHIRVGTTELMMRVTQAKLIDVA
jgi:ferrous iron transport protein A